MSDVAVVIVNYKTPDLAIRCLRSLERERVRVPSLRCLVVDGNSGDDSVERLRAFLSTGGDRSWIELLPLGLNGGFGWANNQAMLRLLQSAYPPSFIHLLNPDTEVEEGAIAALRDELLAHERCGAAGSQLLDPSGAEAGAGFRFPSVAREFARGSRTGAVSRLFGIEPLMIEAEQACEADWVTGASVMLRADALRDAGLFDDGFFLYFEEVELMHRLRRRGWTVRHVPESRVMHLEGAATGVNEQAAAVPRPRPLYWYESRRRLFTRISGPVAAVAASLGWTAGHLIWRLRRLAGLGSASDGVPRELRDLWACGIFPTSFDRKPATVPWDAALDRPPAWMAKR